MGSYHIAQIKDYVLDLKSYHKESQNKNLLGLLWPTHALVEASKAKNNDPLINIVNQRTLVSKLLEITVAEAEIETGFELINPEKWYRSDFCPTPTIVQAAKEMFAESKDGAVIGPASLHALHYAGADESHLEELVEFLVSIVRMRNPVHGDHRIRSMSASESDPAHFGHVAQLNGACRTVVWENRLVRIL